MYLNQSLTGWDREKRSEQSGYTEPSQSLAQKPLVFKLSLPLHPHHRDLRPQGTHLPIVLSQQYAAKHSTATSSRARRAGLPAVNTCQAAVHRAPAWTQVSIGSLNRATGLNSSFSFCLISNSLFICSSIHSFICMPGNILSDSPLRNLRFTGAYEIKIMFIPILHI